MGEGIVGLVAVKLAVKLMRFVLFLLTSHHQGPIFRTKPAVLQMIFAGGTSLYGRDSECFALEECPFQGSEDFAEGNMPDVAHLPDLIP